MSVEQMKIFLADDDIDDCNFFKKVLTSITLDIELTIAHNGEELMALLAHRVELHPHVLFLDLNMPRKNGFECLAEIKLNKKLQTLPVIVFSTSFEKEVVDQLHAAGAQYFIRKPADYDSFASIILKAIDLINEKGLTQTSISDFVIQDIA